MKRVVAVAVVALPVLIWLGLVVQLGAQERGGPAHLGLSIGDGIPASLYTPGDADPGEFPFQSPRGERPPLVVIAHGYSADQQIMSTLARSLAEAGYATMTIDFRGHGSNTDTFKGDLRDDLDAVVDWAVTSPLVDGERIAVLGHSMGAGAALDFGTIDPRPVAIIPVSGGYGVNDAHLPPNVLLLVAENDPEPIHENQRKIARLLSTAGATRLEAVQIDGTDHVTILWNHETVGTIVRFLDPVFGMTRSKAPGIEDPRLVTAGLVLVAALALVAFVGGLASRAIPAALVPHIEGRIGLLVVVLALVVTMPAVGAFPLEPGLLPLGAGLPVATHMALAAGVLWAGRMFALRTPAVGRGRFASALAEGHWLPRRSAFAAGLASAAAIFVLITPAGVVFHRLVPTTERLVLWIVVAALILPFFAAFEALVRRGGAVSAALWGALGRLVLLAILVVGVGIGALPFVLILVVPLLVLQYVLLEIYAAPAYARSRDPALIAVVDAVVVAWFVVTLTPIG